MSPSNRVHTSLPAHSIRMSHAQDTSSADSGVDMSLPPKSRILGRSTSGSEVITGVLLHQKRRAPAGGCSFRFAKLRVDCTLGSLLDASFFTRGPLTPFGREPAFNPVAPQYQPQLQGKEGAYFNVSEGSPELAPSGFPYAFFERPIDGVWRTHHGFPVVFEVRPSEYMSHQHTISSTALVRHGHGVALCGTSPVFLAPRHAWWCH